MSRRMGADAVVVGAGIVGAACAEALAAEGLDVTVFESRFAGGGTTACAMGHLVVMDDSEEQFALTSYSVRLWNERADELPPDLEEEQSGTLWLAANEEELEHARRRAAFYAERGIETEVLSAAEVEREEPNLRSGLAGALLVPGDRIVYPPAAARWLLDRATSLGARRHEGVSVIAIGPRFVTTSEGRVEARVVVNAAGVAASSLTAGLPIEPRKGHLVITDRYPGFCRHQLIELGYLSSAHEPTAESVAFNLQPRANGQMLLGSSREFVGLDGSLNRSIRDRMLLRALDYMPAIGYLSAIRTWVGFRPCTPDNLPIVGPVEDVPGLFVAAGHEGLGVTTSLGTARILADTIVGRTPAIDASPYAPARFARRIANA
jgi:D-hydroxyproline dehydrogenase subunit beta